MSSLGKFIMIPSTERGLKRFAALLGKFLPHVTMTGARITSLDPFTILEDGDVEETPCQDWVPVKDLTIGQSAVVLRQGSRKIVLPLGQ